jgi:hypothetical protein
MHRSQKITFAEMRDSGVRGLLIFCADYRCPLDRDQRRSMAGRSKDLEMRFVC